MAETKQTFVLDKATAKFLEELKRNFDGAPKSAVLRKAISLLKAEKRRRR